MRQHGDPPPTTSRREVQAQPKGLNMLDVLELADPQQRLMNWMIRQKEVSLAEAARQFGQDERAISTILQPLLEQGFLDEVTVADQVRYRIHFALGRGRPQRMTSLWASPGLVRALGSFCAESRERLPSG